jgi:hypothetical protein
MCCVVTETVIWFPTYYVHESLTYSKKTSYVGEFYYFVVWLQKKKLQ